MTTHDDEWLTIRQAADQLGVSDLTIRRRIKDGKIGHRMQHGKYLVNLSLPCSERTNPGRTDAEPEAPELAALHSAGQTAATPSNTTADFNLLLSEYADLARQAGRAALLEERLRLAEEQLATVQGTAMVLSNRNGWLEGKLEERESEIQLLVDSRHRPSLWRRLFGGS